MQLCYISNLYITSTCDIVEKMKTYLYMLEEEGQSEPIVFVLNGNIGNIVYAQENMMCLFNYLSEMCEMVFYIPGPYEYLNNPKEYEGKTHIMDDFDTAMQTFVNVYPNVVLLKDSYYLHRDYYFIGSTLWNIYVRDNMSATREIEDLLKNIYLSRDKPMTWRNFMDMHKESAHCISKNIQECSVDNRCIVSTYYPPIHCPTMVSSTYDNVHVGKTYMGCDLFEENYIFPPEPNTISVWLIGRFYMTQSYEQHNILWKSCIL